MASESAYHNACWAVLGAALLDPTSIDVGAALLAPADFPDEAHGVLWQAMCELRAAGEEVDAITCTSKIEAMGHQGVITLDRIITLGENVLTSVNVRHHVDLVAGYAARRRLAGIGHQIVREASTASIEDLQATADRMAGQILAAVEGRSKPRRIGMREMVKASVDVTKARQLAGGGLLGPTTGFKVMDDLLLGFIPQALFCMGGKTGRGKTALALAMTLNAVRARTHHAMMFSLEMSRVALGHRIISSDGLIDGQALRAGRMEGHEIDAMTAAVKRLIALDDFFSLIDQSGVSMADVRSEVLGYVRERDVAARKHGVWRHFNPDAPEENGPKVPPKLGLVVVDYLQLLGMADAETRERAVAQTSKALCELARIADCCVLALVQWNDLGAIRESRAPEHDSTVLLRLEFDNEDDDPDGSAPTADCHIGITKHRHGPVGKVPLVFDRRRQRFGERAHEDRR